MERGHYYYDIVNHALLIFQEESDGYFWFYFPDEDRHVAYYDFEIEQLREY